MKAFGTLIFDGENQEDGELLVNQFSMNSKRHILWLQLSPQFRYLVKHFVC